MLTKDQLLIAIRNEINRINKKEIFLDALLSFEDESFIDIVYKEILDRFPDEKGKEYYLKGLRNGYLNKVDIILSLINSDEGRSRNKKIIGLKKYKYKRFLKLFTLKNLKNTLSFLFKMPKLISYYDFILKDYENRLNRIEGKLESRFLSDVQYAEFENKFRGPKEKIKKHLTIYLDIIKPIIGRENKYTNKLIIDLGCGRGDWLELLAEYGIKCIGVDINKYFVNSLKKEGFDVIKSDILSFLKDLEDGSVDILTAFHVIEHLDVSERYLLLREGFRVLKEGGLFIIETPNPRNILVGSGDFYVDPTHKTPIFPDTIKFLGELIGYNESISYFIDNNSFKLIKIENYRFDNLEDYINISRDFVWIGKK